MDAIENYSPPSLKSLSIRPILFYELNIDYLPSTLKENIFAIKSLNGEWNVEEIDVQVKSKDGKDLSAQEKNKAIGKLELPSIEKGELMTVDFLYTWRENALLFPSNAWFINHNSFISLRTKYHRCPHQCREIVQSYFYNSGIQRNTWKNVGYWNYNCLNDEYFCPDPHSNKCRMYWERPRGFFPQEQYFYFPPWQKKESFAKDNDFVIWRINQENETLSVLWTCILRRRNFCSYIKCGYCGECFSPSKIPQAAGDASRGAAGGGECSFNSPPLTHSRY